MPPGCLAEGQKQRPAPPYGPYNLRKTLLWVKHTMSNAPVIAFSTGQDLQVRGVFRRLDVASYLCKCLRSPDDSQPSCPDVLLRKASQKHFKSGLT